MAALLSLLLLLPQAILPATAGNDRTLNLYYTHTKKSGQFTFKRDGKYDPRVLKELNVFLADWRTGEPAQMDPALFDLLWLVYQKVGATQPIHIVSSYRSPATNKMLRSKSSGVAENSQHMKGKAMDFFIPGVPLTRLREVAMYYQVGGVGFYPTSGSPFVHLDTGSVRAWPRMTRAQLKKIFPDGKTLHLPADGKVLSAEGRRWAEAEWKKCKMVPCNGMTASPVPDLGGPTIMLASTPPVPAVRSKALLMQTGADMIEGMAMAELEPTQRVVPTIAVQGPHPVQKSRALAVATATIPPLEAPAGAEGETALAALAALGAPVPASRKATEDGEPLMVTAYVPAITPDPGAQLALKMIIERETTGALPPPMPLPKPLGLDDAEVQVASLGSETPPANPSALDAFGAVLQATWDAVGTIGQPQGLQNALLQRTATRADPAFELQAVELIAPDLEHVADTMVQQVPMSATYFGDMYEPEGWLDKGTQLGPLVTRMSVDPLAPVPVYDRFVVDAPLIVAAR